MKIIQNDVSEEEVFREWYRSESWDKPDDYSYEMFIEYRKEMIRRLPSNRKWQEVSLETADCQRLRIMAGSIPWHLIQSGTLDDALKALNSPEECLEAHHNQKYFKNIDEKIKALDALKKSSKRVDDIYIYLRQGGNINPKGIILITDTNASLPLTIVEGHHRILALHKLGMSITRCYVGGCEGDSIWMRKI